MRWLFAVVLVLSGCPSIPEGRFRCSAGEPCPSGMVCGPAGRCVRPLDAASQDAADAPVFDTPMADAPRECVDGTTTGCTTTCGSMGMRGCAGGVRGPCEPPTEICNDADDDCDDLVDERLTRMCAAACGTGEETCVAGMYQGCTGMMGMPEVCNRINDDCDISVDEGLTRTCSTACGTGTETCRDGAYVGCTASVPVIESCNARDDDCNGAVDDGFQVIRLSDVSFAALNAFGTGCSAAASPRPGCWAAAARWCLSNAPCPPGNGLGGFGPTQVAPGSTTTVSCVASTGFERRTVSVADLTAAFGGPFDLSQRAAQAATHRYCRALGFVSGVGPIEVTGGVTADVLCVRAGYGDVVTTSYPAMAATSGIACSAAAIESIECTAAGDAYCALTGYEAGLIVETAPTGEVYLLCIRG